MQPPHNECEYEHNYGSTIDASTGAVTGGTIQWIGVSRGILEDELFLKKIDSDFEAIYLGN